MIRRRYITGFENEGWGHKPRNSASLLPLCFSPSLSLSIHMQNKITTGCHFTLSKLAKTGKSKYSPGYNKIEMLAHLVSFLLW